MMTIKVEHEMVAVSVCCLSPVARCPMLVIMAGGGSRLLSPTESNTLGRVQVMHDALAAVPLPMYMYTPT